MNEFGKNKHINSKENNAAKAYAQLNAKYQKLSKAYSNKSKVIKALKVQICEMRTEIARQEIKYQEKIHNE